MPSSRVRDNHTTPSRQQLGGVPQFKQNLAPVIDADRLPTPLEKTHALVLADHDRRNLLGRWLTLLGVNSCRTALDSTPINSLTPISGNELVVTEVLPESVVRQVAALRTRGWRNIIASTQSLHANQAAVALTRDVRVLLRRSTVPEAKETTTSAEQTQSDTQLPGLKRQAKLAAGQLTNRERTVLQLVARGWTNREIGDHLNLSHLTIKSHLSRISRKLGTGDRACMVLIGMRGEIIA